MRKLTILLVLILLSCSSDDDSCDCRFVDSVNQFVPNNFTDDAIERDWDKLSIEQKQAMNEVCINEDC